MFVLSVFSRGFLIFCAGYCFLVQSWDLLIGGDGCRTGLEVKSGLESLNLGHARVLYLVLGQL